MVFVRGGYSLLLAFNVVIFLMTTNFHYNLILQTKKEF